MKSRVVLIAVLFATPALLAAQSWQPTPSDAAAANSVTVTVSDGKTTKTITLPVVSHPACPVTMQAKQGSGAGLVAVRRQPGQPDNAPSMLDNKPGQRIRLTLGKMPGGPIADLTQLVKGTITARGVSARGRMDRTPADLGGTPSDLHRTFDVTFNSDSDGGVYADLVLPGFTSVRSIRIEQLELKDGSTWSLDSKQGCVVVPDPLMLVASEFQYQPAR